LNEAGLIGNEEGGGRLRSRLLLLDIIHYLDCTWNSITAGEPVRLSRNSHEAFTCIDRCSHFITFEIKPTTVNQVAITQN